ncbi:hypothetical protein BDZ97DRAFT_1759748 [Flammula alnicola]|nr:hypothetical protein BDZ97DRAFT_1759748 [Flammula alnicola]
MCCVRNLKRYKVVNIEQQPTLFEEVEVQRLLRGLHNHPEITKSNTFTSLPTSAGVCPPRQPESGGDPGFEHRLLSYEQHLRSMNSAAEVRFSPVLHEFVEPWTDHRFRNSPQDDEGLRKRFRETGEVVRKPVVSGCPRPLSSLDAMSLEGLVEQQPDIMLSEIAEY